jgi:hypothetical protein
MEDSTTVIFSNFKTVNKSDRDDQKQMGMDTVRLKDFSEEEESIGDGRL